MSKADVFNFFCEAESYLRMVPNASTAWMVRKPLETLFFRARPKIVASASMAGQGVWAAGCPPARRYPLASGYLPQWARAGREAQPYDCMVGVARPRLGHPVDLYRRLLSLTCEFVAPRSLRKGTLVSLMKCKPSLAWLCKRCRKLQTGVCFTRPGWVSVICVSKRTSCPFGTGFAQHVACPRNDLRQQTQIHPKKVRRAAAPRVQRLIKNLPSAKGRLPLYEQLRYSFFRRSMLVARLLLVL